MKNAVLILAHLALAIPATAAAQPWDTSMSHALAQVRAGSGSVAAAFLSQERRSRSAAELDAMADSLVAIATSYGPAESSHIALAAIGALSDAAHPAALAERTRSLADRGIQRLPVAYSRAFDGLVRIFHGSADPGLRSASLYSLTLLPDTARVLAFLADVAATATPNAPTAIRYLSIDMGVAGLETLRGLYIGRAVVEPTAREHIAALASVHGWVRCTSSRAERPARSTPIILAGLLLHVIGNRRAHLMSVRSTYSVIRPSVR